MTHVMITHIGGMDAVIPTTLNLPKIKGGKKLIYTGINMPLTAIEDLPNSAKQIPSLRNWLNWSPKTICCGMQRQRKLCSHISELDRPFGSTEQFYAVPHFLFFQCTAEDDDLITIVFRREL